MDAADFHADVNQNIHADEHIDTDEYANEHIDANRDHDKCARFQYANRDHDQCACFQYANSDHNQCACFKYANSHSDAYPSAVGHAHRDRHAD